MGFWRSVWDTVKDVGRTVVEIVSNASDWIKENILNISETPAYDPNTASFDETKKINELLDKCIKNYSEEAEKFDDMAQDIIKSYFDSIKKELEKIDQNEEIIKEHIFDMFDFQAKEIANRLDKIYSKHIADVFSLNNNKLLDILALEAGRKKQNDLTELAIETLAKAYEKLEYKLKEFSKEQQEFIDTERKRYTDNLEQEFKKEIAETEKIKLDLKKGEEKNNARINEYNYLLNKINKLAVVDR